MRETTNKTKRNERKRSTLSRFFLHFVFVLYLVSVFAVPPRLGACVCVCVCWRVCVCLCSSHCVGWHADCGPCVRPLFKWVYSPVMTVDMDRSRGWLLPIMHTFFNARRSRHSERFSRTLPRTNVFGEILSVPDSKAKPSRHVQFFLTSQSAGWNMTVACRVDVIAIYVWRLCHSL